MYCARVVGAAALCWLVAGSASAQLIDGKGVAYRPWDVQGGVGLHVSTRADGSSPTARMSSGSRRDVSIANRFVSFLLFFALVSGSLSAQSDRETWRALVSALEPAAMVAVRLTDGTRLSGTVLGAGDESFTMKPRARIPVRARTIRFDTVESVERTRVGMNPGLKVLTGIGIGIGGFFLVIAAVLVNSD